jgi:SulP family sulfate permease
MLQRFPLSAVDTRAAINTAIVAVPQEINYGLLALAPLLGLLAQNAGERGIQAALAGGVVAMLVAVAAGCRFGQIFGSRPTLSLLLAALASAILGGEGVWQVIIGDSGALLPLLAATVVLAGVLQMVFAQLSVSRLIKYLPYPVLAGFMNGVAVLLLWAAVRILWADHQWWSLLVCATALAVGFRPWRRGWGRLLPGALQAVLAGALVHGLGGLLLGAAALGQTLPPLNAGWPVLHWSEGWPVLRWWAVWQAIFPYALAMAVIGSLESLLAAATLDGMTGERSDSRRELFAAGLANVAAGLCGGLPVAGSLSRSGMLVNGGARHRSAMLLYALTLLLVLLLCLPLLAGLPKAAIAAILLLVGWQMVNDWTRKLLRQVFWRRGEVARAAQRDLDRQALVMLAVTVTAVASDLKNAVLLGVLLAMALFIQANTRLPFRRIVDGTQRHSLRWRNAQERSWLHEQGRRIVLVEAEGILFFGTGDRLAQEIDRLASERERLDCLILDLRRVVDIDATGARILQQLAQRLRRQGTLLLLAHLAPEEARQGKGRFLRALGLEQDFPLSQWYADDDAALEAAEELLLAQAQEITVREESLALAHSDLGAGLSAEQVRQLAEVMPLRPLAAGEALFRQGEAGDSLFVVGRGTVSIRLPGSDGLPGKRVAAFGPGVVVGEMALLEGKPRSADALADSDCELFELRRSDFDRLAQSTPVLAQQLLRTLACLLAERLRQTTQDLQQSRLG